MSNSPFNDQEVIEGIRKGGLEQEKWLQKLYDQHFSLVYKALQKHKVNEQQALDAYSDALIELRKKIVNGSFRGDSSYFSFFYSIFFNKIFNALAKNKTKKIDWVYEMPSHLSDANQDILKILETNESYEVLLLHLDKLGSPCQEILLDTGYWGYTMQEVAERNQLKDAATARNKKFHCLKKLLSIIQSRNPQSS
ncbi:MAG: sigma-70 family RNA polymerase sigma factor [Bacteroidota bacterium]